MNSQGNIQNTVNISNITVKDDQVNDLMKSIENKLSMLACDDSVGDFQTSKLQSPKRQFYTATNEKKNKFKMNINDLETSIRKQTKESPSRLGQSRIVSRINQMQHYYMNKIQEMAAKLSNMQFDVQNLTQKNEQLHRQNQMLKQSLSRKQRQQSQIVNRKLEQLKSDLIQKFSREAEQHFQQHIKQMRAINESLLQERGKRKYLEQQIALIKAQKTNIEQFYRELLQNHRNLIRLDIKKSQKSHKEHKQQKEHHISHLYNSDAASKKSIEQQQTNTVKKKTKKKEKQSLVRKSQKIASQKLTNEQMIPYLAKGIQDLKDKLKLND